MATIDYKQKIKDYMNSSEVDTLYKSMLNNLFPEFKESEDEMIRKALIELIQGLYKGCCTEEARKERDMFLAWLEKQGEHSNFRNKIQIGDKVTRNKDGVLVNLSQLNRVAKKQDEQKPVVIIPKFRVGDEIKTSNEESLTITKIDEKGYWSEDLFICCFDEECVWDLVEQNPAWSEEDEKQARQIERIVRDDGCTQKLQKQIADWFKSLKERVQPKQEWSEEDEDNMMMIEDRLSDYLDYIREDTSLTKHQKNSMKEEVIGYVNWLKYLKGRAKHQSAWKPSDEQMAVLNEVINYAANSELQHWNNFIYTLLKSLREQLKKLMEE